jgi:hypothetical protein
MCFARNISSFIYSIHCCVCVHQKKFPPRRQKGLTKIGYVYIAVSRGGTIVQGRGKIQTSEQGGKNEEEIKE